MPKREIKPPFCTRKIPFLRHPGHPQWWAGVRAGFGDNPREACEGLFLRETSITSYFPVLKTPGCNFKGWEHLRTIFFQQIQAREVWRGIFLSEGSVWGESKLPFTRSFTNREFPIQDCRRLPCCPFKKDLITKKNWHQLTLRCRLVGFHTSLQVPGHFDCAWRAAAPCCTAGSWPPHLQQNFHSFPPLHVFCMPINTSAATSHWGLHVCKPRQFLAGHSPSSGPPSLPSNALEPSPGAGARALPLVSPPRPKARWKVRGVSSLLTASFHPKLNQFPPHHIKYGPGTWGCVSNPLKISLSAASINTD